jgi:hypothetical protein
MATKDKKARVTPRLCEAPSRLLDRPCPSYARWVGPDLKLYCSLHFMHAFGMKERLQRVEDYEPPRRPKEEKNG